MCILKCWKTFLVFIDGFYRVSCTISGANLIERNAGIYWGALASLRILTRHTFGQFLQRRHIRMTCIVRVSYIKKAVLNWRNIVSDNDNIVLLILRLFLSRFLVGLLASKCSIWLKSFDGWGYIKLALYNFISLIQVTSKVHINHGW